MPNLYQDPTFTPQAQNNILAIIQANNIPAASQGEWLTSIKRVTAYEAQAFLVARKLGPGHYGPALVVDSVYQSQTLTRLRLSVPVLIDYRVPPVPAKGDFFAVQINGLTVVAPTDPDAPNETDERPTNDVPAETES